MSVVARQASSASRAFDVDLPGGVADRLEPGAAPRLSLGGVHRRVVVGTATRMDHVIGGTAQREPAGPVDDVEVQRRVDVQRRVQRGPRLPGLVTDARDEAAGGTGRGQRDGGAVAGQEVPARCETGDLDLQSFGRGVDVPGGRAGCRVLAEHVPRLDRRPQFELDSGDVGDADPRKAEFQVRREPGRIQVEVVGPEIGHDLGDVGHREVRQQEPLVQLGAPADQRGRVPLLGEPRQQRPDQQRLDQGHVGVRRHLEPAQLQQPESSAQRVGTVELVDAELGPVGVAGDVGQQVAQRPVDRPGPVLGVGQPVDLGERDLQLVQGLGTSLVHPRRLAGRADEPAGEQVRQRRMVLPVGQQADQQIGPAEQWRLHRLRATQGEMVAAAGSAVPSVDGEGLGAEPMLAGDRVQAVGQLRQLGPGRRRVHVDLDHPRIGSDHQGLDPRVRWRRVALEDHRRPGLRRGALDQPGQLDELLQPLQRGEVDVHEAVPGLHHQRGPGRCLLGVDHDRPRPVTGRIERRARPGIALLTAELRVLPGDRAERQPHTGRQVARHQDEPAAPGPPGRAGPAFGEPRRQQRQGPGDRTRLISIQFGDQLRTGALGVGLRPRPGRLPHLLGQRRQRILEAGLELLGGQVEVGGDRPGQGLGLGDRLGIGARRTVRVGEQFLIGPQWLAVGPPDQRDLPARQRLAGIPLALAALHQAAAGETVGERSGEPVGQLAFLRAVGGDGPLGRRHVVDRDEGGLAAHRQFDPGRVQAIVDRLADALQVRDLRLAVGLGDPGILLDAPDDVGELHRRLGRLGGPGDRRRRRRVRGRGQRDVAFPGEQRRRRVQADPARPGDVHLGPGVQIGEVLLGTARPVEALLVGGQLHEVAGDEPRGETEVPQRGHQQPGRVAAGPDPPGQGLVRRLDALLHPHRVGDVAVDGRVERAEEDDHRLPALGGGRQRRQPVVQQRAERRRRRVEIGLQVRPQIRRVGERVVLGVVLDEEVERVDHRHVRDQADGDLEFAGLAREDDPGQVVAEGVLLPVDEVIGRGDGQRIRLDGRPGVRCGSEPDDVRADADGPVEPVAGAMFDRDGDHRPPRSLGSAPARVLRILIWVVPDT